MGRTTGPVGGATAWQAGGAALGAGRGRYLTSLAGAATAARQLPLQLLEAPEARLGRSCRRQPGRYWSSRLWAGTGRCGGALRPSPPPAPPPTPARAGPTSSMKAATTLKATRPSSSQRGAGDALQRQRPLQRPGGQDKAHQDGAQDHQGHQEGHWAGGRSLPGQGPRGHQLPQPGVQRVSSLPLHPVCPRVPSSQRVLSPHRPALAPSALHSSVPAQHIPPAQQHRWCTEAGGRAPPWNTAAARMRYWKLDREKTTVFS